MAPLFYTNAQGFGTSGHGWAACSPECLAAYHKERYRREAHRCPLCGREHEP